MYLETLLGDAFKEDMSIEDISKALENIAPPKDDGKETAKLKKLLENANSEAAKYKKELREKQNAEEAAAAELKEHIAQIEARNAELERNEKISSLSIQLLAQGYDAELAKSTANAFIDGDMETFVSNNNKYNETRLKAMEAELLQNTPRPGSGASNGNEYEKHLADAKANGDPVATAYFTRLIAEANNGG